MAKLTICLVSSELAPLAKTGGLADVSAALGRYLHENGHDVAGIHPAVFQHRYGKPWIYGGLIFCRIYIFILVRRPIIFSGVYRAAAGQRSDGLFHRLPGALSPSGPVYSGCRRTFTLYSVVSGGDRILPANGLGAADFSLQRLANRAYFRCI